MCQLRSRALAALRVTLEVQMPGETTRFVRTLETAARDAECARLRGRGLSFTEIGKQMGLTRQSATVAVKRALSEVVGEMAREVRDM